MKKMLSIFLILFAAADASAQFGDLMKKAKKVTSKVTEKMANIELLEEKNVTTSIDDALPVAFWLQDLDDSLEPVEPDDYDSVLDPGYYRLEVLSYCLKAGTHGPTKGDGYLLAPLKGKRADLVYNIITRSSDHPEIAQRDVQVLLWGIIYNTRFTDYDRDFQNRVSPLLSTAEIADLSLDMKNIALEVMPDAVKKTARFYSDFRNKLTNPNIAYGEIERMAMLDGILPDDPFSEYIQSGNWAYIGDGFYGRAMPEGYQKTVYELYKPQKIKETRDNQGRIVKLEHDGYSIEVEYDDAPGRDVIAYGDNGNYPIRRIKSIMLRGPKSGQEYLLENTGWMVRGDGGRLATLKNSSPSSPLAMGFQSKPGLSSTRSSSGDPSLREYRNRINQVQAVKEKVEQYTGKKVPQDFDPKQHEQEGLKKALNPEDLKGKAEWIKKNTEIVSEWGRCANSALAGAESCDGKPGKPDIKKNPAVPATNGKQRIAPSNNPSDHFKRCMKTPNAEGC